MPVLAELQWPQVLAIILVLCLLAVLYRVFRCMSDELQDEFLWALANRIDAARKAADRLSPYITQGATA